MNTETTDRECERAQRSEPDERSEAAQRRAREAVGESEGRSPSDKTDRRERSSEMKRLTIAACLLLGSAACQDNPSAPAGGGVTVLRANVAAASAVPAVTGPEAGGTGSVSIQLN